MHRQVFAGVLLATAAISGSSFADEQILCTHPGRADAVITLQAMSRFNRVPDCISGDFISDLTPVRQMALTVCRLLPGLRTW
jgi:hypothetical protein